MKFPADGYDSFTVKVETRAGIRDRIDGSKDSSRYSFGETELIVSRLKEVNGDHRLRLTWRSELSGFAFT
jgi:hypothetical protein